MAKCKYNSERMGDSFCWLWRQETFMNVYYMVWITYILRDQTNVWREKGTDMNFSRRTQSHLTNCTWPYQLHITSPTAHDLTDCTWSYTVKTSKPDDAEIDWLFSCKFFYQTFAAHLKKDGSFRQESNISTVNINRSPFN